MKSVGIRLVRATLKRFGYLDCTTFVFDAESISYGVGIGHIQVRVNREMGLEYQTSMKYLR